MTLEENRHFVSLVVTYRELKKRDVLSENVKLYNFWKEVHHAVFT